MRIAFIGKGGAGKSTISGTFARLLARRGMAVLAIDCDPMPGLNFALGLPVVDIVIPDEATVKGLPGATSRFSLRPGLDAVGAVEAYAPVGADGVRYLQFGNMRADISSHFRAQAAFRQIISELPPDRWHLVGDLPGGTRQPMLGWATFAETMAVVVEPTPKSISTACRLARLSEATWAPTELVAVANRVRSQADAEYIAERTGLRVLAEIPDDATVAAADRAGVAPLDAGESSAFVGAVEVLVEHFSNREAVV